MHSLRPRIAGLVWGCPSVGRSLSRTAAACVSPSAPPGAAQHFSSPCPPRLRRTHNLFKLLQRVAHLRFLYGLCHIVSTRVRAARFKPSSDERRLAGILFSHFAKSRPYKTHSGKHPNMPLHCGNANSVTLPLIFRASHGALRNNALPPPIVETGIPIGSKLEWK